MTMLRPAILLFILLSLITGGLYPLMTTALGQWWFKDQANGSLIIQNGENRGSRLIGQNLRTRAISRTPFRHCGKPV